MVFTHTYYLPRKLAPSFTLLLYPTVLLDGARPANTCISTLHPLDGARALPGDLGSQGCQGGYAAWCAGTLQGNLCGIQVLADLAPSSQTVGSNKRVTH